MKLIVEYIQDNIKDRNQYGYSSIDQAAYRLTRLCNEIELYEQSISKS